MTELHARRSRLARRVLPALAFALAVARGSGLPMTSDTAFHLVRAGNALLRGSLSAWAQPPGGTHAPLLGSFVTAFGALFTDDPEAKIMVSGCILLGLAAAILASELLALGGTFVAILGAAFLLVPPGIAASFNHRPDAALGGVLLLLASVRALRAEGAPRVLLPAWAATLTTPWAVPAALAWHLTPGLASRRDWRAFAPPLAVAALVALMSASLPAGSRSQILAGLFGEVARPLSTLLEGVRMLRTVWGGGLLMLPLLLGAGPWETRLPARLIAPWCAAAAGAFFLGAPAAFLGATAALAPVAALVFALVASRLPDRAGGEGTRRPLVLALLVPVLVMVVASGDHRRLRSQLRGEAVRDAQLGEILWSRLKDPGAVAAEETGALAALSARAAWPLQPDGSLPAQLPRYVVLRGGELPITVRETVLFDGTVFLGEYAPCIVRRGRMNETEDCVWSRRAPPASPATPEFARALRAAWAARSAGDDSTSELRFREAVACEPGGVGLADEGLGLLLERRGEEPAAVAALERARANDPTCVLARGHLADRALSTGQIPRADSLLTEAFRFERELPELRGTRARLFALAGYAKEAEKESAAAVRAGPDDGRILVNHGILLWRRGATQQAREVWRRAVHADPQQIRYLGKFEAAPDSAPAPPLRPLFSDVGFLVTRPGSAEPSGGRSSSAPPHASQP